MFQAIPRIPTQRLCQIVSLTPPSLTLLHPSTVPMQPVACLAASSTCSVTPNEAQHPTTVSCDHHSGSWLTTLFTAILTPWVVSRSPITSPTTKTCYGHASRPLVSPRPPSSSANSHIACSMWEVNGPSERSGSTALRMSQRSSSLWPSPSTISFCSRMKR